MAEVELTASGGDGSDEYLECIYRKYEWERKVDYETKRLGNYYHGIRDHDLQSGTATGTDVFHYAYGFTYVESRMVPTATQPDTRECSGSRGTDKDLFVVTYPGLVTTARPLPEGDCKFYFNQVPKKYVICDAKPLAERRRDERHIHVTAPEGSLHEAFFDPVAIGEAVGSDQVTYRLPRSTYTASTQCTRQESATLHASPSPHPVHHDGRCPRSWTAWGDNHSAPSSGRVWLL